GGAVLQVGRYAEVEDVVVGEDGQRSEVVDAVGHVEIPQPVDRAAAHAAAGHLFDAGDEVVQAFAGRVVFGAQAEALRVIPVRRGAEAGVAHVCRRLATHVLLGACVVEDV